MRRYHPHIIAILLGMASIPSFSFGFNLIFGGVTLPGIFLLFGPIVLGTIYVVSVVLMLWARNMRGSLLKHFRYFIVTISQSDL